MQCVAQGPRLGFAADRIAAAGGGATGSPARNYRCFCVNPPSSVVNNVYRAMINKFVIKHSDAL